jgi:hypothetical protein
LEHVLLTSVGRMFDALRAVAVDNKTNPAKIDWKC